jgi:hypothetical protein
MKKRLDPSDYSLVKRIDPYMFLDRHGNPVTRKSHMAKYPGKAYAFFDCNAPIGEIKSELPKIRGLCQIPSELELILTEGPGGLERDPMLMKAYEEAGSHTVFPKKMKISDRRMKGIRDANLRYVMQATYPGQTNETAAKELTAILNGAYQSPLFGAEDPFRGAIASKQRGEYIFEE